MLLASERRTAAIYLWGYAAEMTVKASYFSVIGVPEHQTITIADLEAARQSAAIVGTPSFKGLHNIEGWARLLVAKRASLPGLTYPIPGFGNLVITAASRIYSLWREILRYHKNIAYEYEVVQVQTAAQWLLANSSNL